MISGNIFEGASPPATGETFEPLLSIGNLTIERILSSSRIESTEFRQTQHEWVLLLRGEATLSVAGATVHMKHGDFIFLAAETPHSVLSVSDGAVWLGVHLHPESSRSVDTGPAAGAETLS